MLKLLIRRLLFVRAALVVRFDLRPIHHTFAPLTTGLMCCCCSVTFGSVQKENTIVILQHTICLFLPFSFSFSYGQVNFAHLFEVFQTSIYNFPMNIPKSFNSFPQPSHSKNTLPTKDRREKEAKKRTTKIIKLNAKGIVKRCGPTLLPKPCQHTNWRRLAQRLGEYWRAVIPHWNQLTIPPTRNTRSCPKSQTQLLPGGIMAPFDHRVLPARAVLLRRDA